jgi:uncharacterized membrane protein
VAIPQPSERAGTRQWLGLALLVLPTLLLATDITVLYLALPLLSADLGPTGTETLWIIDLYGFVLASLLITMGTLGDRIGRRRLLMIGAVTFGMAALVAAYAMSPAMLIVARHSWASLEPSCSRPRWRSSPRCSKNPRNAPRPSAFGQRAFQHASPWVPWWVVVSSGPSGGARCSS